MDKELLAWIATNSEANKSPAHPNGFCYVPEIQGERLSALETEGHVQVGWQNAAADKSVPARLTDQGMKAAQSAAKPAVVQHPAFQMPVIEDNIPLPDTQRFGRAASGQSAVERYPFHDLSVGQSFFVPGTPGAEKPMHRTFSSVVSQANRKLYPRDFAIREDHMNGTAGARVWRKADLTGPRPQRARKSNQPEQQTGQDAPFGAPAPAPQIGGRTPSSAPNLSQAPAFGGGFAAPGPAPAFSGGPGAPTAFPAPGGSFGAPGAAPAPNAWASGPSFDQGSASDE